MRARGKSRRATRRLSRGGGWLSCMGRKSCKVNEPTRLPARASPPKSETRAARSAERAAQREERAAERNRSRRERGEKRTASKKEREDELKELEKERRMYHMKRLHNSGAYNHLPPEERKKEIIEQAILLSKMNVRERSLTRPFNI